MRNFYLASLLIILGGMTAMARAQSLPAPLDEKRIGASRYFIEGEDELLIPVNILGWVNKPGQYMVPSVTDLIALVAYAGGFKEDAKINEVKIVRKMGNQKKPKIMQIDLEKFYTTGDPQSTPPLMPDDTIIIANKKSVKTKTVAEVIRSLAYAAQIVYIFVLIDRN